MPVFLLQFFDYHLIIALPQVKPLPKAASTTVSPSFTLPCSQASVRAIGIEAAVVFPYFRYRYAYPAPGEFEDFSIRAAEV